MTATASFDGAWGIHLHVVGDSRTCANCLIQDGKAHPMSEGVEACRKLVTACENKNGCRCVAERLAVAPEPEAAVAGVIDTPVYDVAASGKIIWSPRERVAMAKAKVKPRRTRWV
jgi:CxxC motif-containing protein (DUF1111 family)